MRVPFLFGALYKALLQPRQTLLPLLMVSLLATGVSFLPPAAGLTGRWVLLALLAVHLLIDRRSAGGVNPALILTMTAYVVWCSLTAFWSDVPWLSWSKVAALALTVFTALWAGQAWVIGHTRHQVFSYLWPATAVTFAAGISSGNAAVFRAGAMSLHAGATVNPNFLGAIVGLSLPFVLWKVYHRWSSTRSRALWSALALAFLVILYLTASRGAYLIVFGTLGGMLLALSPRRMLLLAVGTVWSVGLISVGAPNLAGSWAMRNIYKYSDAELGVFYRRQLVWSDSWDAAAAGGLTGAGYGVSIGGDVALLDSMVSSHHYQREKGNSQLAIVEETGLIGLGLYLLLLGVLSRQLLAGFWRSPRGELRVARGLVLGTLAGLMLHSFLEAWWVGPGSPEFVFFWVMAGTGLGLARVARSEKLAGVRAGVSLARRTA